MFAHKKINIFFCLIFISLFALQIVYAQTATPTPTNGQSADIQQLNQKIDELTHKISDLRTQENTLSSEIAVMDNQTKLTEYRIDATKQQINQLSGDITVANTQMHNLERSLNDVTKILINRIVATYQVGSIQPIQILLASSDVSDFFTRANYLRIVQDHDKQLIYDTQQTKK